MIGIHSHQAEGCLDPNARFRGQIPHKDRARVRAWYSCQLSPVSVRQLERRGPLPLAQASGTRELRSERVTEFAVGL
jgi:hypothetical protein